MKIVWKYRFFPAMAIGILLQYNDYDDLGFFLFLVAIMDLARVYKPSKQLISLNKIKNAGAQCYGMVKR